MICIPVDSFYLSMNPAPNLVTYPIASKVMAFSTTRHGGVGTGNYATFNINPYCGDDNIAITANRKALADVLGLTPHNVLLAHQVHGDSCLVVDEKIVGLTDAERTDALEGYDALITQLDEVCIGVSTADCIPVLLYDTRRRATAAIHAGWRGTVRRIVAKTLRTMAATFGTCSADIRAVIGPGISLANFEVGQEVYDCFAEARFDMSRIARRYDKWHIDLPLCNRLQLQEAGVPCDNILVSDICTYDHADDFFSARRLGVASGRIYTGIVLR